MGCSWPALLHTAYKYGKRILQFVLYHPRGMCGLFHWVWPGLTETCCNPVVYCTVSYVYCSKLQEPGSLGSSTRPFAYLTVRSTGWFKMMDSISYVYISWTIHGMWMIYITFERGSPKFSNTTARALAYRTAVQQRQLRAKWLLCSTIFFTFVSSLKLSRRLLCSVRFVFVSTFSLQRGRAFVAGITNLSK